LFRAERQVVVRVDSPSRPSPPPDDHRGRLAVLAAPHPRDAGPVRLSLPASAPELVPVDDDPGYCLLGLGHAEPWGTTSTPSAIPMPSAAASLAQ
jgi:hypothetical protein